MKFSKSFPAKPLSPMMIWPGRMRWRSWRSIVSAASRFPIFGFASPQMMGIPSGVRIR